MVLRPHDAAAGEERRSKQDRCTQQAENANGTRGDEDRTNHCGGACEGWDCAMRTF